MLRVERIFELRNQRRQRQPNRIPKDLLVNVEIGMHNPVSHTDDLAPRYIASLDRRRISHLRGGFPDDFHSTRHGHAEHRILIEIARLPTMHKS